MRHTSKRFLKRDGERTTRGRGLALVGLVGLMLVGLMLVGLVLGCGTSPAPDSGSDAGSDRTPEWTLRRDVVIGSVDHPVYAFSGVRAVLADEDHVYVLLIQEALVRVFTRSGEFVREFGREGEGPAELLMPSGMGWHGSRLWVANWGSTRFTFFDVESGEAEAISFRPDVPPTLYAGGWAPEALDELHARQEPRQGHRGLGLAMDHLPSEPIAERRRGGTAAR